MKNKTQSKTIKTNPAGRNSAQSKTIPFSKLSKAGKRRAIAQDVLDQIKARKMIPTHLTFVRFENDELDFEKAMAMEDAISAQELTVKQLLAQHAPAKQCNVCALGGLLMGQFSVNGDCEMDQLEVNSYTNSLDISPFSQDASLDVLAEDFSPFILRYFTAKQLQLIEIAFESGVGAFQLADSLQEWRDYPNERVDIAQDLKEQGLLASPKEGVAAIKFGQRYNSAEARLVAIMKKIVGNPEGLFVP